MPIIQQSVEEVRRIGMNLRPAILDDLGLLPTRGLVGVTNNPF